MTTLAARQGHTSNRPRMSVAFLSVLIVVVLGVAAAVTLPRLLSSQSATTGPGTVQPLSNTHTSDHSGFPATGVDEWPRAAAQPSPGAKHPLGRAIHTGAQTQNSPRQLQHGHVL